MSDEMKVVPTMRIHECSDGKKRNDEQFEEYKKHEESLVLKKQQFEKHPEEFVHVDDIVVAALKSEHGIGVMIGKCNRQEMELALVRISYRGFSMFQQMEIRQAIEQEKKGIITPNGKSGKIIV